MEPQIQITRIERTDVEVDNSKYEFKIPYEVEDDFGNKGTFYRKEERLCSEYDAQIAKEKLAAQQSLEKVLATEAALEEVNSKIIIK